MSKIIKTLSGTLADPKKIALGSASSITRNGPFYNFSIRIDPNDIREYSFTNRERAENMRQVLIGHLEQKFRKDLKAANFKK